MLGAARGLPGLLARRTGSSSPSTQPRPAWGEGRSNLAAVRIAYAPLWLAATNCYVVSDDEGGPGVIVDAPPDPAAIAEVVRRTGVCRFGT